MTPVFGVTIAEVAQLVEHATENRGVASSILALGTYASALRWLMEYPTRLAPSNGTPA